MDQGVEEVETLRFPSNFFWGSSTSAYQVEGAVAEDGRAPTIWDQFASQPGATYQGHTGEVAADHYHRLTEDVALMQKLGLNSYCFSVAWSRIIPEGTGAINQKGLDYYARVVDTLLAAGITPIAKLYHWDLPLALHEKGGWLHRDSAYAFADYAEVVVKQLGDRVPYWITHNEPWCAAFLGYGIGIHAPGMRDPQAAVDAAHHLLLSHGIAMKALRTHVSPTTKLGIALNLYPVYPVDDSSETLAAGEIADAFKNRWFLDPLFRGNYPSNYFEDMKLKAPPIHNEDMRIIAAPLDFLAVNYYSRSVIRTAQDHTPFEEIPIIPGSTYTGMNWEIYPQGLTDLLVRLHKDYQPTTIFITENGSAFDDHWDGGNIVHDPERREYLRQHIHAIYNARTQGVPVQGYFAWSLLDNFEWAEGYNKRFGITYVDFATQRRILKDSGKWYSEFIQGQK